jgi:hypothetical protein
MRGQPPPGGANTRLRQIDEKLVSEKSFEINGLYVFSGVPGGFGMALPRCVRAVE